MEIEQVVFQIILHAGDARNYAMEALRLARSKNYTEAKEFLKKSKEELSKAHHAQTTLLQEEAGHWREELHWDYRGALELIKRFLDAHALSGCVAL